MSERRLTVPLDSDLYLWLTELTMRQQDRGIHASPNRRQKIGKDRAINRILEWVRHTAATNVKAVVGEEAAATLLSVSNEKTAKVYARVTAEAVRRIMDELRAKKNPSTEPGQDQ